MTGYWCPVSFAKRGQSVYMRTGLGEYVCLRLVSPGDVLAPLKPI